jgi:orotidine-5'-phosphate decarboxylase
MKKPLRDYLALALDGLQEINQLERIIDQTSKFCGTYKIGLELFTRFGPCLIDIIRKSKRNIFLDLKYHDIPNTVAKAVQSASRLGVQYCTIHTQGGAAMMAAAVSAARSALEKGLLPPKLIGVTLLTSIDEQCLHQELNVDLPLADYILHLVGLAIASGMNGIVCSAADLPFIKRQLPVVPLGFEIVTPGIRRKGSGAHDQKRTATPDEAISFGATLLVIGREVTLASDPAIAAQAIIDDLTGIPLVK